MAVEWLRTTADEGRWEISTEAASLNRTLSQAQKQALNSIEIKGLFKW